VATSECLSNTKEKVQVAASFHVGVGESLVSRRLIHRKHRRVQVIANIKTKRANGRFVANSSTYVLGQIIEIARQAAHLTLAGVLAQMGKAPGQVPGRGEHIARVVENDKTHIVAEPR